MLLYQKNQKMFFLELQASLVIMVTSLFISAVFPERNESEKVIHEIPVSATAKFSSSDSHKTLLLTSDWMASIPDDQSLSLMSIPGTHESCSLYGGELIQCQTMSLPELLNAGIRFLDIRCRVLGDGFTIHHGSVYQHMVFGTVLEQCIDFLLAHPTETVLMRIKQEYSTAPESQFIALFDNYRFKKGYEGKPFGEYMYVEATVPNLGRVRGKIVIIANVPGLPGIPWDTLSIQDDFWVPSVQDIKIKWSKVKAHLDLAAKEHHQGSKTLFLNFASGTGIIIHPDTIAKEINNNLYDYISGGLYSYMNPRVNEYCYYGIIAMDFPNKFDSGVIEQIIKQNRRKEFIGQPVVSIFNTYYGHYMYASQFPDKKNVLGRHVLGLVKGDLVTETFWILLEKAGTYTIYNTFYKEFLYTLDITIGKLYEVRTWIKGDWADKWIIEKCWDRINTAFKNERLQNYLYENEIWFGGEQREIFCWEPGVQAKQSCWDVTTVGFAK